VRIEKGGLGCRIRLQARAKGPLGWLFQLFYQGRWTQELRESARRLARG